MADTNGTDVEDAREAARSAHEAEAERLKAELLADVDSREKSREDERRRQQAAMRSRLAKRRERQAAARRAREKRAAHEAAEKEAAARMAAQAAAMAAEEAGEVPSGKVRPPLAAAPPRGAPAAVVAAAGTLSETWLELREATQRLGTLERVWGGKVARAIVPRLRGLNVRSHWDRVTRLREAAEAGVEHAQRRQADAWASLSAGGGGLTTRAALSDFGSRAVPSAAAAVGRFAGAVRNLSPLLPGLLAASDLEGARRTLVNARAAFEEAGEYREDAVQELDGAEAKIKEAAILASQLESALWHRERQDWTAKDRLEGWQDNQGTETHDLDIENVIQSITQAVQAAKHAGTTTAAIAEEVAAERDELERTARGIGVDQRRAVDKVATANEILNQIRASPEGGPEWRAALREAGALVSEAQEAIRNARSAEEYAGKAATVSVSARADAVAEWQTAVAEAGRAADAARRAAQRCEGLAEGPVLRETQRATELLAAETDAAARLSSAEALLDDEKEELRALTASGALVSASVLATRIGAAIELAETAAEAARAVRSKCRRAPSKAAVQWAIRQARLRPPTQTLTKQRSLRATRTHGLLKVEAAENPTHSSSSSSSSSSSEEEEESQQTSSLLKSISSKATMGIEDTVPSAILRLMDPPEAQTGRGEELLRVPRPKPGEVGWIAVGAVRAFILACAQASRLAAEARLIRRAVVRSGGMSSADRSRALAAGLSRLEVAKGHRSLAAVLCDLAPSPHSNLPRSVAAVVDHLIATQGPHSTRFFRALTERSSSVRFEGGGVEDPNVSDKGAQSDFRDALARLRGVTASFQEALANMRARGLARLPAALAGPLKTALESANRTLTTADRLLPPRKERAAFYRKRLTATIVETMQGAVANAEFAVERFKRQVDEAELAVSQWSRRKRNERKITNTPVRPTESKSPPTDSPRRPFQRALVRAASKSSVDMDDEDGESENHSPMTSSSRPAVTFAESKAPPPRRALSGSRYSSEEHYSMRSAAESKLPQQQNAPPPQHAPPVMQRYYSYSPSPQQHFRSLPQTTGYPPPSPQFSGAPPPTYSTPSSPAMPAIHAPHGYGIYAPPGGFIPPSPVRYVSQGPPQQHWSSPAPSPVEYARRAPLHNGPPPAHRSVSVGPPQRYMGGGGGGGGGPPHSPALSSAGRSVASNF